MWQKIENIFIYSNIYIHIRLFHTKLVLKQRGKDMPFSHEELIEFFILGSQQQLELSIWLAAFSLILLKWICPCFHQRRIYSRLKPKENQIHHLHICLSLPVTHRANNIQLSYKKPTPPNTTNTKPTKKPTNHKQKTNIWLFFPLSQRRGGDTNKIAVIQL